VISNAESDELLLSFCEKHWLKVARIVGKAMQALEERGVQLGRGQAAELIDARMEFLVGTRRLEARGNIREWRRSEVRLPASTQRSST
jgi:Protein of unknown function